MRIISIEITDHDGKRTRIDYMTPSRTRAFEVIDRCDDPSMKHPMQALADRVVTQDRERLTVHVINNLRTLLEANDTRNGYTKAQREEMYDTTAPAPGQEGGE